MILILDTNILIAAIIKKSITREILTHPEMQYFVPEFTFEEIEINKKEILNKSKLSKHQFESLLDEIKENLTTIPSDEIKYKKEAQQIKMDHIDTEDTIFIALALSTQNDGIWSQDKHFEQQKRIKIWKTEDLMNYLGITHN